MYEEVTAGFHEPSSVTDGWQRSGQWDSHVLDGAPIVLRGPRGRRGMDHVKACRKNAGLISPLADQAPRRPCMMLHLAESGLIEKPFAACGRAERQFAYASKWSGGPRSITMWEMFGDDELPNASNYAAAGAAARRPPGDAIFGGRHQTSTRQQLKASEIHVRARLALG